MAMPLKPSISKGMYRMSFQVDDKLFFSMQINLLSGAMYDLALYLTKNSDDAQDLVADTVIEAWPAFDALKHGSQFQQWIFRMLLNRFKSDYRKAPHQERFLHFRGHVFHCNIK